jgi:hypothetical protein
MGTATTEVVVIGVHGKVGIAVDLCIRILVPSLPRRRLAPSAESAGQEQPREARDASQTSDCAWLKGWGEGAIRDVFR